MSFEARGDAAAEAGDSGAPLGSHAYLGELQDVDRVTHSLFLEGAVVRLPLVFLPDIVRGQQLSSWHLAGRRVCVIELHIGIRCSSQATSFRCVCSRP